MNAGSLSLFGLVSLAIPLGAPAADIVGLGAELPEVAFDVPSQVVARDVTPAEFTTTHPGRRLVQIDVPVSVVVYHGDVHRVEEVVVEIDGGDSRLAVHSYAPQTRLDSEYTKEIETKKTTEDGQTVDASLGGALPMVCGVGTAQVTPTVGVSQLDKDVQTETSYRKPPQEAVVVSGTTNGRSGAYFKLRKNSQTTLEGEHLLQVTFEAPANWRGGSVQVTSVARGERKWLFVKERTTWSEANQPVKLRLASYEVAKPIVDTTITD